MSNFAYYYALGVVPSLTVIPHGWFEHVEQSIVKSPNFTDGSTHAPGSPVIVGGAGMTISPLVGINVVTGLLNIDGGEFHVKFGSVGVFEGEAVSTSGSTTSWLSGSLATFDAGSTLNVGATTTFSGPVTAASIALSTIQITDTLFTGPDSVSNLTGSLDVGGQTDLHGVAIHHADTYLQGTIVQANLVFSGEGKMAERVAIGPNASATFSAADASMVYIPASTITSTRSYSVAEAGAIDGNRIRFYRADSAPEFNVSIRRPVDGTIIATLNRAYSTTYSWIDVMRIAGYWQLVGGEHGVEL